jgi:xylan 1,4-beta-xylosidase
MGKTVTNTSDFGGWLMLGGVDLGNGQRAPQKIEISASSLAGGQIEVWMDDINEKGKHIATVNVLPTGNFDSFQTFSTKVMGVSGQHHIYLKFPVAKISVYLNTIRFR